MATQLDSWKISQLKALALGLNIEVSDPVGSQMPTAPRTDPHLYAAAELRRDRHRATLAT